MPSQGIPIVAAALSLVVVWASPAVANVAPSPTHYRELMPTILCSEAPETADEGEECPYFPTCELIDGLGGRRATFHARVDWWEPVDMDRVILALATCRSPAEERTTDDMSPGDATLELLEVFLPPDGWPRWRLLARELRGEWGCVQGASTAEVACAAVHVSRGLVATWILDPGATPTAAARARPDTTAPVLSIHETPRLRHHEGRFQVWLDEPAGWFDLVPMPPTTNAREGEGSSGPAPPETPGISGNAQP